MQTPYALPRVPMATQPEIIRASQKDNYYLALLQDQLDNAARTIFGQRWLQRWSREVSLGSRLLYLSLTTFIGHQTLGEEYTDILQFSSISRSTPKRSRRLALLALHILAPYALSIAYTKFRQRIRRTQDMREALREVSDEDEFNDTFLQRIAYQLQLPTFDEIVEQQIKPFHLAIFYLTGKYYSLAKRSLRIRYLSTQPPLPNMAKPPSYEVLGAMMAVQFMVRLLIGLRNWRAKVKERAQKVIAAKKEAEAALHNEGKDPSGIERRVKPTIDERPIDAMTFDPENPTPIAEIDQDDEGYETAYEDDVPQEKRCTLCLGARRDPTCTECGHVFCWECIVGWAREKAECPLCRQTVSLSQLVPVYNL